MPISGKFHYYEAGWLFYMRTHKCPICGTILEKANQSLVVNSKSKEAKKYNDFWCGEFRLEGGHKLGEFVATRTYRGHGKDEKKSKVR